MTKFWWEARSPSRGLHHRRRCARSRRRAGPGAPAPRAPGVPRHDDPIARRHGADAQVRHVFIDPNMPFGGFKESGQGRDFGMNWLDGYLEDKRVHRALIARRSFRSDLPGRCAVKARVTDHSPKVSSCLDIDRRQMKTGLIPGLLCQVATSSQLLVAIGRHMGDWQKVPQNENGKG